ncbi:hypothetical protein F2P81_017239 [Scophthalmus maximus]|uniref:Uncharacterized protein n=1 Tax=Scophthalmus maximus TaxID=52904 RepID=A0A6A4SE29_SCOMX|nr:hypothetical protein F2P81_017239 [Scophthalmus maximus]
MWSERNTVGETTKYDGQMQRERKQKGRRDKSSPPPRDEAPCDGRRGPATLTMMLGINQLSATLRLKLIPLSCLHAPVKPDNGSLDPSPEAISLFSQSPVVPAYLHVDE